MATYRLARGIRGATVVVCMTMATMAAGGAVSTLGAGAATTSMPPACPVAAPTPAGTPSAKGRLLSGGVAAIRLCRYTTLPPRRVQSQHLTRSPTLIRRLYNELGALLPIPEGVTACPAGTESEIVILARYRSGKTAKVIVDFSVGCTTVSRGRVEKSAEFSPGGPALLGELRRLTP